VQKLKNLSGAERLLQIMQSYMRFDKDFLSSSNVIGMLRTALSLSQNHSPVNQIPFANVQDSKDPATDTRLFISNASLQSIYTQFMTGDGTQNPKRVTKTTKRKKVKTSAVSGLENASHLGEDMAVLADPKLDFPFYFPEYRTLGSQYVNDDPYVYKIADEKGKRHQAYRIVIEAPGAGEYYGLQGTTWKSPPFLADPDRVVNQNSRKLLLFYDGSHLRAVGWKTPRAAYWISNTLTYEISNARMIAIAASMTHLKQ
jgi:hypothetical protein